MNYCTCFSGGINPSCRQHGSPSYLLDQLAEAKEVLDRAHKLFGSESDKFGATIKELNAEIEIWKIACKTNEVYDEMKAEVERLSQLLWGSRCVYCGETIGKENKNQDIADDFLKEHVSQCEKHPAFILRKENTELSSKLHEAVEAIREASVCSQCGGTGKTNVTEDGISKWNTSCWKCPESKGTQEWAFKILSSTHSGRSDFKENMTDVSALSKKLVDKNAKIEAMQKVCEASREVCFGNSGVYKPLMKLTEALKALDELGMR